MNQKMKRFLQEFVETGSPSGHELEAQRLWCETARSLGAEVELDRQGNAFARINPKGKPNVLLMGHGDIIGFMVRKIDDKGFILFSGVGGHDPSIVPGREVVLHCAKGPVRGIVGAKPIHQQDRGEGAKPPKLHEMHIDIGATKASEAKKVVNVGDYISISPLWVPLMGDRVAARAFDYKVGGVAALEALRLLKNADLKACVTAVSTVQEENTQGGAASTAMTLKPDVALVVDVGLATDYPGGSDNKLPDSELGKGPVISIGSANHALVVKRLEAVARKKKIKYQRGISPNRTGTDGDTVQQFGWGAPVAVIDIPLRYMHTPVETVSTGDIWLAGKLMAEFCISLTARDDFRYKL